MVFFRGWIALRARRPGARPRPTWRSALEAGRGARRARPRRAALLALRPRRAGALRRGRRAAATSTGWTATLPEQPGVQPGRCSGAARVRPLQRPPDEALADALEVGRRYERFDIRRAVPPWRSLAAIAAGRARATRSGALALAREELELAERWGTPHGDRHRAARARAGHRRHRPSSRRRSTLLERSPARLELARARVELGAALRRRRPARRRRASRCALAMDEAHACGAAALAERARDELRATGARPRRLALSGADALTASERRVARAGRRRADQPPDRPGAVRHHRDGRDAPAPRRSRSSRSAGARSWRPRRLKSQGGPMRRSAAAPAAGRRMATTTAQHAAPELATRSLEIMESGRRSPTSSALIHPDAYNREPSRRAARVARAAARRPSTPPRCGCATPSRTCTGSCTTSSPRAT